ncbi:uncharacterized protein E5676_scaffold2750G00360 [Cucumis melo var. makuwa]|uniref:CACTA en-spm transposon protein n=1 Tax=Cucumis melo var. makuwa TaxID=1194695 RepID=A0A5A7ULJ4_CUCMM|nr:uncharacterized protein E6C27_scaffold24G001610 [Cucumis melo var. makuwa]TYJ96838.1 uncharacterized protein E5676_scaffold2750G00360 [Cucumis melo var. makuwa]
MLRSHRLALSIECKDSNLDPIRKSKRTGEGGEAPDGLVDFFKWRLTRLRERGRKLEVPRLDFNDQAMNSIKCETVLGRRSGYSKGLGWGPKPKARKTTSVSSSMTSCLQSTVELQLQANFDEAMQQIEE